jgi:serine protease inhibitor ecotin
MVFCPQSKKRTNIFMLLIGDAILYDFFSSLELGADMKEE